MDEVRWGRWWRDLIVERYREAAFEQIAPLAAAPNPSWADRVRLGRLVDRSLVEVHGPAATGELVGDALRTTGFGVPGDPSVDRRSGRATPWSPTRAGDDDLRLGILGTIAEALLRRDPPSSASAAGALGPSGPCLTDVVTSATRSAVLAYAAHVEGRAGWTLQASRARHAEHARV